MRKCSGTFEWLFCAIHPKAAPTLYTHNVAKPNNCTNWQLRRQVQFRFPS